MELRCSAKKHAVLVEEGILEIKCGSRFCGAERGVIVLHRFALGTGELIETQKFKDPIRKEKVDAAYHHPAAVRSA